MKLKTKEEIKNDYWMRFLRTGKIEDYIMFRKYSENNFDEEYAEFGVTNDNSKQETNRRGNY